MGAREHAILTHSRDLLVLKLHFEKHSLLEGFLGPPGLMEGKSDRLKRSVGKYTSLYPQVPSARPSGEHESAPAEPRAPQGCCFQETMSSRSRAPSTVSREPWADGSLGCSSLPSTAPAPGPAPGSPGLGRLSTLQTTALPREHQGSGVYGLWSGWVG